MKIITKSIWIVSLVSLFTDVASEMLYPVLPLYFKSIGFSIVLIGVLEGVAEATAGLSKGYFGKLSDASGKRVPFVKLGYSLSAIAKPMFAAFTWPVWVFFARTLDRLGKGIRTGARDALLSDQSTPETKGRVFGFHRAMDTTGAFLGPIIALLFMEWKPGSYTTLFYLAVIPGIVAIALTFMIKDRRAAAADGRRSPVGFLATFSYVKSAPIAYKRIVFGLLAFAFFNSSDMFLLLMIKQSGVSDMGVIGFYIFYNAVYASLGYPMGAVGDKIGLKKTFIGGAIIFACVYAGMAVTSGFVAFGVLFFLYGVFAAMNEGIMKAWISNVCEKKDVATALGTFAGLNSIVALLASVVAGLIWSAAGPVVMFMVSAAGVVGVVFYFLLIKFQTVNT